MLPREEKLGHALEAQMEAGVAVLRRGGLVAFPTDTLYALGADAFNEAAVQRVFQAKGRPTGMPLPLLLAHPQDLDQVAAEVSPLARRLARRFWPGPLTLVVPAGPQVPALTTARGWTVGVRVPNHPVPRALARRLGHPITGTSANRSGGPEPHTSEDVRRSLGDHVDLIIQNGPVPGGQPSTILDVTTSPPRLLRLGALSAEALEEFCGTIIAASRRE